MCEFCENNVAEEGSFLCLDCLQSLRLEIEDGELLTDDFFEEADYNE